MAGETAARSKGDDDDDDDDDEGELEFGWRTGTVEGMGEARESCSSGKAAWPLE